MHHLSTVNLDTRSEFITTGVSFFVLFVFSWRLHTQCRCTRPRPNQTPCMFPAPPGGGALPAAPGSSPIGRSVGFWTQHTALFHFPSKICWGFQISFWWAHPGLLSPYVFCVFDCTGGILEGIGGLHSKWCGLSKLFSIFIIEMDQSPYFFFSWWFEVVRVVSYCLIKFSDQKNPHKNPSVPCVPNSDVVLSHLRRNRFSLLAWPRMTAAPVRLLGYRQLLRDTWGLYYHCSFWEVPDHAVFLLSWSEFLFLFAFVKKKTNSGCFC